MSNDFAETEILGHNFRFRPVEARTPDGLRICAQDWRSEDVASPGRDVLLIHGTSQSHQCWFKQLSSPLRERYRFVTYDLRGHGGSDKPLSAQYYQDGTRWAGEVQAVIEAAGLVRPVIVAWSYAGRVALDYLQMAGGDAISGVVLVAGTASADRSLFGSATPLLKRMAEVTDMSENIAATREFLCACVAGTLPVAELEFMLAYNLLVPPVVRRAMGGRPAPYDRLLRSLTVPVLAVHGAEDRFNLPAMAQYTARTCPNARAIIYAGVGHTPFWEVPEQFNADLAGYLDAICT